MKKLIIIPDKIHDILEEQKSLTGRAISSMIQEALYKWMVHERLMIPKLVKLYYDEKSNKFFTEEEYDLIKGNGKEVKGATPPEGVMFCDSDKCEMPVVIGLPPQE